MDLNSHELLQLSDLRELRHLPVMPARLEVRLIMPRNGEAPRVLHDGVIRAFVDLLRLVLDLAIDLLRRHYVSEAGSLRQLLDLTGLELRIAAVEQILVLVRPVVLLAQLELGLADSQRRSGRDLVQVVEVASQEVAVEFLEDLTGLNFKLVEVKERIEGLHGLHCTGAAGLHLHHVDGLSSPLHDRAL